MALRGSAYLKWIDRIVGTPLLVFFGLLKTKRLPPKNPKRIGILVTAAIGDTVLTSTLSLGLKAVLPHCHIILIYGPSNAIIASFTEGYDESIQIEITNPWKAISPLRKLDLDVLIDSGQWARLNALLSFFSGARFTIGFNTPGQFRHWAYDQTVSHSSEWHEIHNFSSLGTPWAAKSVTPQLKFKSSGKTDPKKITIHIKPSGEKFWLKEWPMPSWIELINKLTSDGFQISLTGSPSDGNYLNPLREKCKHKEQVQVLAGSASFLETLISIQESLLVISVNTGIMHLASLMNKNLVALHGPTNAKRWGPINSNSISISSGLPCSPCLNLGFEYGCGENLCMQSISVKKVYEACFHFIYQ